MFEDYLSISTMSNDQVKRVGLFGGTFNPIHLGHLRAVQEVAEGFALDRVYLIPSAIPPHKALKGIVQAEDRLEMTRLAVSGNPGFRVSDVELKRSGPSYTIDTIHHFRAVLPGDTELCFMLGLDAFLEIDLWKSYRELFQQIPFIVMIRPGYGDKDSMPVLLEKLGSFLKSRIAEGYQYSALKHAYIHAEKHPIYIFDANFMEISSTDIRKRIREGRSIRFLVPENVEDFIKTKGLFL